MTGYESGEIEKIDRARHKEEVEVETTGSCEGEESQGRDEARLRGENRETGKHRSEEKRKERSCGGQGVKKNLAVTVYHTRMLLVWSKSMS